MIERPNKYELSSVMYNYEKYKETSIIGRNVRLAQIQPILERHKNNSLFEIEKAGSSFENRDINLIKIGSGDTKVFFWSQMHGDESTSTRAIFDLLNFFSAEDDTLSIKEKILSNITLYIIPMLNPDGSERFTRENAQLIDINRDAIAQQTPEGKLLYELKNKINPDFGFNLHDQSSGYSAGKSYKSSTISLLAPPFNESIDTNETRLCSMKLIVALFNELNDVIPGHIARYDDEFEPRAFGDNFTKDGVSTILIEAGGWATDPEREYVRKVYFSALVKSLLSIADKSYESENENIYYEIPENKERLYDLILRNVSVKNVENNYSVDIAIKHNEFLDQDSNKIYYKGSIADIGDLSTFHGYAEQDMAGFELHLPELSSDNTLISVEELLKNRIAYIKSNENKLKWTKKPINYYNFMEPSRELKIDGPANFFLSKNSETKFAIINGFMIDLSKPIRFTKNGLILP